MRALIKLTEMAMEAAAASGKGASAGEQASRLMFGEVAGAGVNLERVGLASIGRGSDAAADLAGSGSFFGRAQGSRLELPVNLRDTSLEARLNDLGIKADRVNSNFAGSNSTSYEANVRFARINVPAIDGLDARTGIPARTIKVLDDTTQPGRVYQASREPFAMIVRLGATPHSAFASGSGFVARPDGLIAAARHTVRNGFASGDIWVSLPHQPIPPFQARIVGEKALEDIALLKPISPLPGPVRFVPMSNYASRVDNGAGLLTVGAPDVSLTMTGRVPTAIGGTMHATLGRTLGRGDLVHYLNEPEAFMYRTTTVADYGMSGGASYDIASGRLVGAIQAGRDYKWSAVTPADKIRELVMRTP